MEKGEAGLLRSPGTSKEHIGDPCSSMVEGFLHSKQHGEEIQQRAGVSKSNHGRHC